MIDLTIICAFIHCWNYINLGVKKEKNFKIRNVLSSRIRTYITGHKKAVIEKEVPIH